MSFSNVKTCTTTHDKNQFAFHCCTSISSSVEISQCYNKLLKRFLTQEIDQTYQYFKFLRSIYIQRSNSSTWLRCIISYYFVIVNFLGRLIAPIVLTYVTYYFQSTTRPVTASNPQKKREIFTQQSATSKTDCQVFWAQIETKTAQEGTERLIRHIARHTEDSETNSNVARPMFTVSFNEQQSQHPTRTSEVNLQRTVSDQRPPRLCEAGVCRTAQQFWEEHRTQKQVFNVWSPARLVPNRRTENIRAAVRRQFTIDSVEAFHLRLTATLYQTKCARIAQNQPAAAWASTKPPKRPCPAMKPWQMGQLVVPVAHLTGNLFTTTLHFTHVHNGQLMRFAVCPVSSRVPWPHIQ